MNTYALVRRPALSNVILSYGQYFERRECTWSDWMSMNTIRKKEKKDQYQ